MLVTCEVSKLLTLSEVREEQPSNIPPMWVTCEVSKLLTLSEVREEQPKNILLMSVTCEVSNKPKSREVRYLLFWNIACMFVTCEVFRLDTSICRPQKLRNISTIDVQPVVSARKSHPTNEPSVNLSSKL